MLTDILFLLKYQKLKQQQFELQTLHSTLEQLRSEASVMRDRHRNYEEDLMKRVKTAREACKTAEGEVTSLKDTITLKDEEIKSLKGEIDKNNARSVA
jgi:SMC interacting uncharacterized protein involved in chromosome segregation